ncbi:MAG: CoA-binding protein, partial [Candidatus Latescibacteria bacterium]|nr:CoA-binding protein [Candidatus Latescibacterota bacterium]
MSILAGSHSNIMVQGITGREASMVVKHMREYGTPVVAGVTPGKGNSYVCDNPVFDTVSAAKMHVEINTSSIYVPPLSALDACVEALDNGIELLLIITENVPLHDMMKIITLAEEKHTRVVGPNSVGIITPGSRAKLGPIGGDNPDRCFIPGNIGIISRSGGMTAEIALTLKRQGWGVSTAISVGGDPIL